MITDRDIRRVRQLKSDARLAPTQLKSASIAAWRISISVDLSEGRTQWAFSARLLSARLLDGSHSTDEDWSDLGRLTAAVGAPSDPVVPISETNPENVHHWAWLDGKDGKPVRLTLEKEFVNAIRESVVSAPRGRPS